MLCICMHIGMVCLRVLCILGSIVCNVLIDLVNMICLFSAANSAWLFYDMHTYSFPRNMSLMYLVCMNAGPMSVHCH